MPSKVLIVLRSVFYINGLLLVLALFPWWNGDAKRPGFADYLLGSYRFGGFRADVVWLAFTTILFVSFCFFVFEGFIEGKEAWRVRDMDMLLCFILMGGLVAFVIRGPWF
jgi:hypothetical protein